jgi:hypothetical protein
MSKMNWTTLTVLPAALIASLGVSARPAMAGPSVLAEFPQYTLTAFPGIAPGGATQPDDLAVSADGTALWIGYGNGACTFGPAEIGTSNCPTGTTANSNLIEYSLSGTCPVLLNISIPGHLDGLKIDPKTNKVWATENEDGNPTLTIVNPKNGKFKTYTFDNGLPFDGGMDDLVFSGRNSKSQFIVMSSESSSSEPVIAEIKKLKVKNTTLTSTQVGNPSAVWNVVTNSSESTDLIGDPDSMTLDPAGELVLDNRSDDSLYVIRSSTSPNGVLRVPLTDSVTGDPVEVNDTIFMQSASSLTSSTAGTIFITDTTANNKNGIIYELKKPYFPSNEVYTAENVAGVVGLVDLNTGKVTAIATGFTSPHGLAFAPANVAIAPK